MPQDLEYEAFLVRHRREENKLLADMRTAIAKIQAPAQPLTSEQRLAALVAILQEEFDKLATPLPVPVARVGMGGVDRLAQQLLGERGVQNLHGASPDQYRRAVRDVLDRLQNGQLSPADLGYRRAGRS